MYGAIDKKSEQGYTDLKKVFDSIDNKQNEYNWLITDCECYPSTTKTEEIMSNKYYWITGEELTGLVDKEHLQWIWAVLSGFDKSIELSEVLKYDLPYADGYRGFWELPVTIQHPLASIEIVPWDSSLVLCISNEKDIVDKFLNNYKYSQTIEEYINEY
ncbi:MAG: hypothetical protein IJD68_05165 [Ruminococcus sp.]|nr:hypothetical protein [Ruminococcus sp.]